MSAPRQVIHRQARRIGGLDQKDTVTGNAPQGAQLRLAREDMEGIQHQAHVRVRRPAYHFPAIAVVVDVSAPGQGFIGHA